MRLAPTFRGSNKNTGPNQTQINFDYYNRTPMINYLLNLTWMFPIIINQNRCQKYQDSIELKFNGTEETDEPD